MITLKGALWGASSPLPWSLAPTTNVVADIKQCVADNMHGMADISHVTANISHRGGVQTQK